MHIPPFLRIQSSVNTPYPYSAVYSHDLGEMPTSARVLWWPCTASHGVPDVIIFFIPGNPGCIDFYMEYLNELHAGLSPHVAVFGKSHLGHSPLGDRSTEILYNLTSLESQVQSALKFSCTLREAYPMAKFVVIGHSVGAWIATQFLKESIPRANVTLLLFPTLSNIARTPNGLKLSWLFWPVTSSIISYLAYLAILFPVAVFRILFPDWPNHQLLVLKRFCGSPFSVSASLRMARDEMRTIKNLDGALLEANNSHIYIYYALHDAWVGAERSCVTNVLRSSRRVHIDALMQHAFCINTDHSRQVAQKSVDWLLEDVMTKLK